MTNAQLPTKSRVSVSPNVSKAITSKRIALPKPVVEIGLKSVPNEKVYKRTVTLPGFKTRQAISYVVRDNLAVYEGDIVLGNATGVVGAKPAPHPKKRDFSEFGTVARRSDGLTSRVSDRIIDRNWLWRFGIIPYKINSGFTSSERQAILDAINELNERTNLNIIPRNGQDHYVVFKKKAGMVGAGRSPVGRQRRPNDIYLNTDASKNTVIHELLHSAGIWHEQSRSDRDRYITVLFDNILNGQKHNFNKHSSTGYKVTPYDRNSLDAL